MTNRAPNVGVTRPPSASVAPPYSPKWGIRRRFPVRLPRPSFLEAVPEGIPYFVPIFDSATLFQSPQSAGSNGKLGAFQSYENDFELTEDFWWIENMASVQGASAQSVLVQIYTSIQNPDGSQSNYTWQKTPIPYSMIFGSASEPFTLERPQLLPAGTQIVVNAQNTTANPLAIQLVLMGYLAAAQIRAQAEAS